MTVVHRFGEFELCEGSGELRRSGEPVPLQAKPFALLRYLIEHRDRTVPKDELLARLWPDVVVGEASLSSALRDVRRALGDDGRTQRWLQTRRGQGFRFVGAVEAVQPRPASGARDAVPFVGREAPLEQLRAALEGAKAGRGRVVLLAGEAGIGKTRTARACAALAEANGFEVRECWCAEDNEAPAYWPWIQLVRAALRERGSEGLRRALGDAVSELARLAPELRGAVPEARPDEPVGGETRFRVLDALGRLVRHEAGEGPFLLILEDVHWADAASLSALAFVAREVANLPVFVLGTYRPEEIDASHPLFEAQASLLRCPDSQRLELHGLSSDEVGELVDKLSGDAPLPSGAIFQRTRGNPFFVTEIVRDLREADADRSAAALVGVPSSVRAVLQRNLGRLSDSARRCVSVAALIGSRFSVPVLASASETERSTVFGGLEEAEKRGIVQRSDTGPADFEFTHDLVRDTLKAGLPARERAHVHERIAQSLEQLGSHAADASFEVAAQLLAAARCGGEAGPALEAARRNARLAFEQRAYEGAAQQIEHALEALELGAQSDDVTRCELLLELAEARSWTDPVEETRETVREAAELARRLGDFERLARAAVAQAAHQVVALGHRDAERIALLDEALAGLGPESSTLRVRVLTVLADHLRAAGERERAEGLMAEAIDAAGRSGDSSLRAFVLQTRTWHQWTDVPAERFEIAKELLELAELEGLEETAAIAQHALVNAYLSFGDLQAADREFAALARRIDGARLLRLAWVPHAYGACRALVEGRFGDAEQAARRAFELTSRDNVQAAQGHLFAALYLIWREQGRLDELLAPIESLLESAESDAEAGFSIGIGLVLAEVGRVEEARCELERQARDGFAKVCSQAGAMFSLVMLAELCARIEARPHAERLYELLLPRAAELLVEDIHCVWAPVSLVLGRLARLGCRWEDAEQHFQNALEQLTAMRAGPLLARTRCEYARMLLERDAPGDRERAEALLDPAIRTAAELGMPILHSEAEALQTSARAVVSLHAHRRRRSAR